MTYQEYSILSNVEKRLFIIKWLKEANRIQRKLNKGIK